MAKLPSSNRLFEVRLDGGQNRKTWRNFHDVVTELNGKAPDYAGITNVAVIGTHHDQATLTNIITGEMKSDVGLSITEITAETLEDSIHATYRDLLDRYFLPYGNYPAVEG